MMRLKAPALAITLLIPVAVFAADVNGDGVGTPPGNSTPPEKIEKPAQDAAAMPDGNLSEKLDQSNGVIKPKSDVDPKIEKPAPSAGSMPVLTPPAGPGSKSGVEAK